MFVRVWRICSAGRVGYPGGSALLVCRLCLWPGGRNGVGGRRLCGGIVTCFRRTVPITRARLRCGGPFRLLVTIVLDTRYASGQMGVVAPPLCQSFPAPRTLTTSAPRIVCRCVQDMDCPGGGTGRLINVTRVLIGSFRDRMPKALRRLIGLPKIKHGATGIVRDMMFGGTTVTMSARIFHIDRHVKLIPRAYAAPLTARGCLVGCVPGRVIPATRR